MSRALRLAAEFLKATGGCRCLDPDARACIEARWKRHSWGAVPEGRSCTCACHVAAERGTASTGRRNGDPE